MGEKLEVIWTDFAKDKLQEIYQYYFVNASDNVANRLVDKLVDSTDILITTPFIGQREELLIDFSEDFRYLVERNYKIVYFVQDNKVFITNVFDCRQNPVAIRDFKL